MVILLSTSLLSPVGVNRSFIYKKKGRGGAHGVSLVGGAWLVSSAALWMLIFLQTGSSMVIDGRESMSMGCIPFLFHPLHHCLLPPLSFLPRLCSFHRLLCQFVLCWLLQVFLVLLLALAHLVARCVAAM